LIVTGDREIIEIILLTLYVSGVAVLISMVLGLPRTFYRAESFQDKKVFCLSGQYRDGSSPGCCWLFISLMLWRSGPFGFLSIMYTPTAMIIAQVLIAAPIIAGVTLAAVQQINPAKLKLQALSLGASGLRSSGLWQKRQSFPHSLRSWQVLAALSLK
jgi:tungstate transport system permease protein